jgi:type VI secretion system secreted protein VgrG
MPVTQTERLISVKTALGEDVLLLEALSGEEAMSQLFQFTLYLVSDDRSVSFGSIVGKPATVEIETQDGTRYISGVISDFSQGSATRLCRYQARLVPWLWNLTRTADCRIFQDKTVPEIIEQIFEDLGYSSGNDYKLKLTGTYEPRTYCVQYRETDFDFVSRLMEEEGIFYFFEHSADGHVMVLGDSAQACPPCPEDSGFTYGPERGEVRTDAVTSWVYEQEVCPAEYTHTDYNFETPSTDLKVSAPTVAEVGRNDKLEIYDYPGEYLERAEGDRYAKLRMEEQETTHTVIEGTSTCRPFVTGHVFDLTDHYRADFNGSYVLTSVAHQASSNIVGDDASYSNTFTRIPKDVPFRPPRVTPRPFVRGLQTAVVVGKDGEEIWTDKYGRIRVQFHWDREGEKDENSTCWLRVAQPWAGKQWGAHFWPRIGHEVLVAFLEGDPDRPIVIGSLYNAENMPPYEMPDHQTRSGVKTRSTKDGDSETFNELRFEDKKDEEEIYFHAERDFNRVVENNDTLRVGFDKQDDGDQEIEIFNNQTLKIGTQDCKEGSQEVEIWKDQKVTIGNAQSNGGQEVTIWKDRDVTISMGNDILNVQKGNQTTKIDLGKSETEAMQSIELKVGQSSIKVDQMGVTIKGMMVKVEGQIQTEIKGMMTQVKGDAMLMAKGGITMIN